MAASSDSSADLEDLFDDWLEGQDSGRESDFEDFVARHPAAAEGLRRLHAQWTRLEARLESAFPPPLDSALGGLPDGSGADDVVVHLTPGQVVAGDFQVVRRVGQGGMGTVWEAEQRSVRRRVALKVMRPGRANGRAAELFSKEAQAGGRVHHPGLVTVLAVGEADGVHYIAQELVGDGESLADLISRLRKATTLPRDHYRGVASLFLQVAEAVAAAHQAGVLHRDLKPSNILLDAQGRPRVSDFGLARLMDDEQGGRAGLVGTYPYMSPEQADGGLGALDARSDVFSLGAVFYEVLTLRRAFEGDSAEQILEQVRQGEPPDPRAIRSGVPRDLAVICLEALARARTRRYQSMSAMAEDLRRFLADEPILARPAGAPERLGKWGRRHPAVTTALVLGAVLLVVVTALLSRETELRRDAEGQRDRADTMAAEARANAELAAREASSALRQGYLASIRAAALHLERGDHAEARARLLACEPGLRGWEWHHYALRADNALYALSAHGGAVEAVATSGDGSLVATGSDDGTLALWNGRDGSLRERISMPGGAVHAVAVTADGSRVAAGGEGGQVSVHLPGQASPGAVAAIHEAPVTALLFDPASGHLLSAAEDGSVHLWDGQASRAVLSSTADGVIGMALVEEGSVLVTLSRLGSVRLWDVATSQLLFTPVSYRGELVALAASPDGRRLFTGSERGTIHVWDGETGDELDVLEAHPAGVSVLAVVGDGRRLVSASAAADAVLLWDLSARTAVAQLSGHDGPLTSLAVSTDGGLVVAGSRDGRGYGWDGRTGGAVVAIPHADGPPTALATSADASVMVTASVPRRSLRLLREGAGPALQGHKAIVTSVAVSGDGAVVASGSYDGSVRLWDGVTGELRAELVGHDSGVTSVALGAAGLVVASGSHDRTVRVWDGATAEGLVTHPGLPGAVTSLAMDGAASRLVAGTGDGSVLLWDGLEAAPRTLRAGQGFDDGTVALSVDGSRAAWASLQSDLVVVWEVPTGVEQARLVGFRRGVAEVALSPDGRRVVSTSVGGSDLKLWDPDGGELLAVLPGHTGEVVSVVFSPDGGRIVSGSRDGTVRIWESRLSRARALWADVDG